MSETQITKSDKELIQERINDLKEGISSQRSTGKTYRKINSIIEDLFNNPIGHKIILSDTSPANDFNDLKKFIDKFTKRMKNDFSDINYRITYSGNNQAFVERRTETYQETAKKRLEQWENKLKEME